MSEDIIGTITHNLPDRRTGSPSERLVLSKVRLGIEVELEGICVETSSSVEEYGNCLWRAVGDGSLNNGTEFVSQILMGEDIPNALNELENFINEGEMEPSTSDRTSVHIHMDVRSWNRDNLSKFLIIYLLFERSLFRYCGKGRNDNLYCIPLSSVLHSEWIDKLISSDLKDIFGRGGITHVHKYLALNPYAMIEHGTLEFRHHSGTYLASEILAWVNILLSIRKFSNSIEMKDLQGVIDRVCLDSQALFEEVFGGTLSYVNRQTKPDMFEGARDAQSVLPSYFVDQGRQTKILSEYINKDVEVPEEVESETPLWVSESLARSVLDGSEVSGLMMSQYVRPSIRRR